MFIDKPLLAKQRKSQLHKDQFIKNNDLNTGPSNHESRKDNSSDLSQLLNSSALQELDKSIDLKAESKVARYIKEN